MDIYESGEKEKDYPIYTGPLYRCCFCETLYISYDFLIKHQKKCENLKILSILKIKLKLKGGKQDLHFGITNRGQQTLIYKSHEYVKHRTTTQDVVHWRCRQYQTSKCKSIIHTRGGEVIKNPQEHTHNILPLEKRQRQQMRGTFFDEFQFKIKKRQRKKIQTEPIPENIHFDIPKKYVRYILYDSGINDKERIILLGTQSLVKLLENNELWITDGTFKKVPELLFHLFSIHIQKENISYPCILALLPGKSEEIYNKMIQAIKKIIPLARPERILIDFDLIKVFKSFFPYAYIEGCLFHLFHSVLTKINELGLKKLYENESSHSFAVSVKMLCALSLLPLNEVLDGFDQVLQQFSLEENVEQFLSYFESTFIRGRRIDAALKREEALFPPHLWNHHQRILDAVARTTNEVDGWHCSLQSSYQCSQPTMWKFLDELVKEIDYQQLLVDQSIIGKTISKRKKYKTLKKRLEQLVETYYSSDDRLYFLKSLALML